MFKFHITGFEGNGSSYWSNRPIDITVFAEKLTEAVLKAETVLGSTISANQRQIIIEEMVGEG